MSNWLGKKLFLSDDFKGTESPIIHIWSSKILQGFLISPHPKGTYSDGIKIKYAGKHAS